MSGLLVSPQDYFKALVVEGLEARKVKAPTPVQGYLVRLLSHYVNTHNLYKSPATVGDESPQPQTLAEMYLIAQQSELMRKLDLLRELGDRALYVGGYFGDSLKRKIVDIDYYIQMGEAAYGQLSTSHKDEELGQVYWTLSSRFVDYVDVLTVISHKVNVHSDKDLLRLYDKYLKTGSELAKDRLLELGVLNASTMGPKVLKQS
jgi:hypothetical protein